MVAHHLIGHGVSIHAPAGGATVPAGDSDEDFMFQSTRLREARLQEKPITQRKYPFQSTRLREARRDVIQNPLIQIAFQSTRLREARPNQTR